MLSESQSATNVSPAQVPSDDELYYSFTLCALSSQAWIACHLFLGALKSSNKSARSLCRYE